MKNKYIIKAYSHEARDWYEVGVFEGIDKEDAIKNCKLAEMKQCPDIFAGLKLEAWRLSNRFDRF